MDSLKRMETEKSLGVRVKKSEDMPEWYSQVVIKSGLADYSSIRGCLVIRPYGYAIWQTIQDEFNKVLKKRGVENAYFPIFIPESFFKKEAEHAKGFSPEVAWVENKDEDSQERLALRPTSETIMYDSYSRWIRSWRDLPLKINQWCNVVRWEVKDVKPFLRSREFLWQEGHCVYETEGEATKEAIMMLKEYKRLCEFLLGVPVIAGKKTEREKFAGAAFTTTIEAFMPDGKALQMGTSHNLGQGFAHAFNIRYLGKNELFEYPFQTSWGFSTRLIGAMVMLHGDDKGLVLPPRAAPIKAVIVPILVSDGEMNKKILSKAKDLMKMIRTDVRIDDREGYSAGWKFNDWEMKGVPLRIELGPKDLDRQQVVMVRRDTGEKTVVPWNEIARKSKEILESIQNNLFERAKVIMESHKVEANSWDEFMKAADGRKLVKAPFCGRVECEEDIQVASKGATSRVIPFEWEKDKPKVPCVRCGKEAKCFCWFARSY